MQEPKSILVAVDGSEPSLEAVRYVCSLFADRPVRLTLFHVKNRLPEPYHGMEKLSPAGKNLPDLEAWAAKREQNIGRFMDEAAKVAAKAGLTSVSIRIQDRRAGVGRDILAESQKGFDALVIGRNDKGPHPSILLGGVASKLIAATAGAPLWLVGGCQAPGKILIAMDNSEDAMRAVEYAGQILSPKHHELLLLHVSRGYEYYVEELDGIVAPGFAGGGLETVEMESVMADARARLEKAGFGPGKVGVKIIQDASSRTEAICAEAREGGFGTLVLGRRGASRAKEFFMGRVSYKASHLAHEMAVWIVG